MNIWIRKISVILITIMTLGMYIPPTYITTDADENKETFDSKTSTSKGVSIPVLEVMEQEETELTLVNDEAFNDDYFINMITNKAREQTMAKLGPKIAKQVEDDFVSTILPQMEEVLRTVLVKAGEEEFTHYNITEWPTNGSGERIFNVYNYRTKKDIAKFHVRRDNRPLEGYWFNFHYHLSNDGFEEHHDIGEIYWDKNIPPKWMS